MSKVLDDDCLVPLSGGTSGIFNLEETLLSWKATAFVEHKAWPNVSAAAEEISKYKAACDLAIHIAKHVFLQHKAFSHLPKNNPVEPARLKTWADSGLTLVKPFVEELTLAKFESNFLKPIQDELASLYSKGLESVAPLVSKCAKGLLGTGIGKQVRAETMQRIPSSHMLGDVVDKFLQAGCNTCVCYPDFPALQCSSLLLLFSI